MLYTYTHWKYFMILWRNIYAENQFIKSCFYAKAYFDKAFQIQYQISFKIKLWLNAIFIQEKNLNNILLLWSCRWNLTIYWCKLSKKSNFKMTLEKLKKKIVTWNKEKRWKKLDHNILGKWTKGRKSLASGAHIPEADTRH